MKIYQVPVQGVFTTNAYFYIDEESRHGFLIDPGAQGKDLARIIQHQGWTIEKILLTHGHFDHTGGIQDLKKYYDIPVYCHTKGRQYLLDPVLNLSRANGPDILIKPDATFQEGDILSLQANPSCQLRVRYTPGHTQDSVVFYAADSHTAFVGDTIFKGEPGLTIFPTGDPQRLLASILRKVLTLPEDTILLSGHSQPTTVQQEKLHYPIYA